MPRVFQGTLVHYQQNLGYDCMYLALPAPTLTVAPGGGAPNPKSRTLRHGLAYIAYHVT
jgi:hypothetical protein